DRAGALHTRTVETLDLRGLLDRFLDGTATAAGMPFAGMFREALDFGHLDTRHHYTALVPQSRTTALLTARAQELGVEIRPGHTVVGLAQDGDGVDVDVTGPDGAYRVRAAYLAGCDGGRSTVRQLAAIPFPGVDASLSA